MGGKEGSLALVFKWFSSDGHHSQLYMSIALLLGLSYNLFITY